MARTLDALKVCAAKLGRAKVRRSRLVATEACRVAENGGEFLARVRDRLGLEIEILTPEVEARLAVSGSAALIDASCDFVLVFDIGGGSSELILLTSRGATASATAALPAGSTRSTAWSPGPRCPSVS